MLTNATRDTGNLRDSLRQRRDQGALVDELQLQLTQVRAN